jgi:phytoene synthase
MVVEQDPVADDPAGGPEEARAVVRAKAAALGSPQAWQATLGRHARTFRFAARLLPPESRDPVAGLYTWCRFTDDLVDESDAPPEEQERLLDAWAELCHAAWHDGPVGVPLLDRVLGGAAERRIPWDYARELLEGVRMDIRPRRYRTRDELALYTRRVAGVVGAWMTELFGVHHPDVLEEALRMGHAMQLTNILRDVGEDWARGRLYLPEDLLEEHGLTGGAPPEWVPEPGRPRPAYRAALGQLAAEAHRAYDRSFRALPALPGRARVAMAVAARGYEGILRALARNGWDNVHRRAYTTTPRKVGLAARAVWQLALI